MKTKVLLSTMLILLAPLGLQASESINVKVKGMVCSFCSTGIEKTFSKQPSVEKVKVNMDEKVVFLTLKESGQLSDAKIKELITDSGFNVAGIERKKAQPKAAK